MGGRLAPEIRLRAGQRPFRRGFDLAQLSYSSGQDPKERFQSATERLETPSEMQKARREVARIKTLQREREIAAAKKPAGQGA